MLSGDDADTVAAKLLEPIFDITRRWGENREAVTQHLAGVAAELSPEIGKKFFIGLMERPRNELARMGMRYFLIYARLPTFIEIVEEGAMLIRGDVHRLKAYMGVITPGILRIAGNDEAATRFLCGLCESVNEGTPRKVQEKVIDTIDFIYISLKLAKGRSALINSSKHFLPDLRTLLASSLEIDMTDTHL